MAKGHTAARFGVWSAPIRLRKSGYVLITPDGVFASIRRFSFSIGAMHKVLAECMKYG